VNEEDLPTAPVPLPAGGPLEQVRWALRLSRDVVQDEGAAEFARRGAGIVQRRWEHARRPDVRRTAATVAADLWDRTRGTVADQAAARRRPPAGLRPATGGLLIVHAPGSPVGRPERIRLWRELAARTGHPPTVLPLTDIAGCLGLVPTSACLVLLDLPWSARTARLVSVAREAGRPVVVEATGPWHDAAIVRADANLAAGPWPVRDELLRQAPGRLRLLRSADAVVVPTDALADALAGALAAHRPAVVPDAADGDLALWQRGVDADPVVRQWRSRPHPPTLVFVAGRPGWRADFTAAEPAVLEVLRQLPQARLRLLGVERAPASLVVLGDRVEVLPPLSPGNTVREAALGSAIVGRLAPTRVNAVRGSAAALLAAAARVPVVGAAGGTAAALVADLLAALGPGGAGAAPLDTAGMDRAALPAARALLDTLTTAGGRP
jgi:hypothetical protein